MKSMECNPIKENGLFSSNVNLLNLFWELQNGDKETRLTASSKLTSAVLMSQNQVRLVLHMFDGLMENQ